MAKLQKTIRSNQSINYGINLPQEKIEEIGWEKGDNISIGLERDNSEKLVLVLRRD